MEETLVKGAVDSYVEKIGLGFLEHPCVHAAVWPGCVVYKLIQKLCESGEIIGLADPVPKLSLSLVKSAIASGTEG